MWTTVSLSILGVALVGVLITVPVVCVRYRRLKEKQRLQRDFHAMSIAT